MQNKRQSESIFYIGISVMGVLIAIVFALVGYSAYPQINPPPVPPQTFTARVSLASPNGDNVVVYIKSIIQVFKGVGEKPDINFIGELCAVIPSGDANRCYAKDVNLLLNTLTLNSIESGHWCATKTGDDYTEPVPC